MRIPTFKLIALAAPESTDADLLVRFVAKRDEAAFEELVRRHGPAVLRVCRRLVGLAAADDAFQAVFLVLACRAKAVRKAASVGSWLIGVAGRVARQMRQQLRRKQGAALDSQDDIADPSQPSPDSHLVIPELAAALDEELTRLPDALRAPVVLCLVEGRTQEQAAAELGGSLRTLRRRLDRAKALLRLRLERRGVVPAVIAALVCDMQTTSAVPPELMRQTSDGVFEFLAGGLGVRAAPATIAKGVMTSMTTFKAAVLVPVAACVLVGLGMVWAQDKPGPKQPDLSLPPLGAKGEVKDPLSESPVPAVEPGRETVVNIKPGEDFHRSTNFLVHAPTATMARAIAAEAEYQRDELAKLWLGKELPAWDKPCEIRYTTGIATEMRGLYALTFRTAKEPLSARIDLSGDFLAILTTTLPHYMMNVVIVSHFGKQLLPWADTGLAIATESPEFQAKQDKFGRELLNAGRGIRLRKLFLMREFPKDMPALDSQAYSVTRFLLAQKVNVGPAVLKDISYPFPVRLFQNVTNGQQQFIVFLHLGMEKNTIESWDNAAKTVYGFESVDALEEAWLNYLRKPESVIKQSGKLPDSPLKPKNPDTIPPTTLPGVERPR
jgi:RNA polymerase sigma factor (sigma-70 family)